MPRINDNFCIPEQENQCGIPILKNIVNYSTNLKKFEHHVRESI